MARTLRRAAPRIPTGLLATLLILGTAHLAARWCYPDPIARPALRAKVDRLSQSRPMFIIAGDSRARCGLIPAVFSDSLGLEAGRVVNLAESACDSSATLAAFEEFSTRFANRPVILLGISFFSVNDGAESIVGDELLWSLRFAERCRVAPLSRALAASFLCEKAAWNDLIGDWGSTPPAPESRGFASQPGRNNLTGWSSQKRTEQVRKLMVEWYSRPNIEGLRWGKLERDLTRLAASGAHVVVLDAPIHPTLSEALHTGPEGAFDRVFHTRLRALCERMGLNYLGYGPECFDLADPDALFHDLVHLNERGAAVYSTIVAEDVRKLAASARLALQRVPATGRDRWAARSLRP